MLERLLSFLSERRESKGPKPWNAEPADLIKATRYLLREYTRYSQRSVDEVKIAYLQALEDGSSDEKVSMLKEEYEHRAARTSFRLVRPAIVKGLES